jgi:hypothetical protein
MISADKPRVDAPSALCGERIAMMATVMLPVSCGAGTLRITHHFKF